MKLTKKSLIYAISLALLAVVIAFVITRLVPGEIGDVATITLTNTSATLTLSPGVYVVHNEPGVFNWEGELAPTQLETLAELGTPEFFQDYPREVADVQAIFVMDVPLGPGESIDIALPNAGAYISGIHEVADTNDGVVVIDSAPIEHGSYEAANFDAGFEENAELGSGFTGGQPDGRLGVEANVNNGVATEPQAPVSVHPQLPTALLRAEFQ